MNEPTVTISLETYNDLLLAHERLEMLLDNIYDGGCLTWDKKRIDFNDVTMGAVLHFIDPHGYQEAFESLLDEERREGNGNG